MTITRQVLASFAATLLGVATAHAETFSFSFGNASDLFAGAGTISGSPNALGNILITEISGTTRITPGGPDLAIESLVPVGEGLYHDNVVGVTGGYTFDSAGLSYQLSDGTQIVLFGDIGAYLQIAGDPTVQELVPTTLTLDTAVAATPEPDSIVLLGTGLLGFAYLAGRRPRTALGPIRS